MIRFAALTMMAVFFLMGCVPEDTKAVDGVKVHRFEISSKIPQCVQWEGKRIYQHGWFFTRIGDAHDAPGLEIFYIKGTAEHTAYTATGELLWQWSDPKGRPSTVRVDSNVPLFDFDGDGKLELVVFRHKGDEAQPRLCRLDAATGDVLAWSPETVPLVPEVYQHPTAIDNHVSLVPARLGDGKWSLLLHDDYAQISAFDADLNRLWIRPLDALGHATVPVDVDGDGVEEFYAGVALVDAAGNVIWDRKNLLEGTGENHPDTNPVVMVDGQEQLFFGPGARILDAKGEIIWQLSGLELTEVQSVRVLSQRDSKAQTLVLTDLPARRDLQWRGMTQRAVDSVNYFLNGDLEFVGKVAGCHTPMAGDWDGDGNDELVLLDEDLQHLLVINQNAEVIDRIAIQDRVYVSDMRMAPVLPGAKGEQIIMNEWSDDWQEAHCVIIENQNAEGNRSDWDQLESARWTAY